MDVRVLVIDDQPKREANYRWLCNAVGEKGSINVLLDFNCDPNSLLPQLQRGGYSAILVDGVLTGENPNNWPDRQDLKWVLGQIQHYAPKTPMALLSSNWGDIDFDAINMAWTSISCRALMRWEDIEDRNSYVVSIVQALIHMNAGLTRAENIQQGEPLRILHLSDLQFGGFNEKRLKLEAGLMAERILEYTENMPPHFIAITGDIAEHGLPSEYRSANIWLNSFCSRLGFDGLPRDRIWIVPGNHDVNLALGVASRLCVEGATDDHGKPVDAPPKISLENTIQHQELLYYAYKPYRDFVNSVSNILEFEVKDGEGGGREAWVETRYRHLGLIAYGVNTAQPFTGFNWPDRTINADTLSKIGELISPHLTGDNAPLVIGFCHHSPLGQEGKSSITNPGEFEVFFNSGTKTGLVFQGHVHANGTPYATAGNGNYRIVRVVAPTLTKESKSRPEDTLRGLSLVQLDRDESNYITEVHVKTLLWFNNTLQENSGQKGASKIRYVRHRPDGMFKQEIQ